MNDAEYRKFCKELTGVAGIKATHGKRNDLEQRYYDHHRALGVRLTAKYRR